MVTSQIITPANLSLQISGVAPSVIRELSGIFPTFSCAFKELINNSYDADAAKIKVSFAQDLGTIVVEDDGAGMTPFEFQDEYIRIGGSVRRQGNQLTPGGRQPIGQKGIGFLAVARYCHRVEIHSSTDRQVPFQEQLAREPGMGDPGNRRFRFFQSVFASALAPYTYVQSVRYGANEISQDNFRQDGLNIEFAADTWAKLSPIGSMQDSSEQMLTVDFVVDCSRVNLHAIIDYDYVLGLKDDNNLERLEDFCYIGLIPDTDPTRPHYTRVTLHLHEFVQRELQAPKRRGRIRNVVSSSGLDRFLWNLSRNIPVSYDVSSEELHQRGLGELTYPISHTQFTVRVITPTSEAFDLRRPLLGELGASGQGQVVLVRQPVHIETSELAARGYLLGFAQPVFPAELRGIAVRVRGVEVGRPGFLGIENDILVRYRPFLSQVLGEIIITEGFDALSTIMPGREGFYEETPQYQALRWLLVGDGVTDLGLLGRVLEQLCEQHSVESSVARIVQETRRRRDSFLAISQVITELSIGSRYGRALRRLFSRSDIVANGLRDTPQYQSPLPATIGNFSLELSDSTERDYELDVGNNVVRLKSNSDIWDSSLYILGRDFRISLRNGNPNDPVCEIDFATNTVYINWMHPTRNKMGDATFVKSALSWRIAYLAADGDVDVMMNLAHRLLSSTT